MFFKFLFQMITIISVTSMEPWVPGDHKEKRTGNWKQGVLSSRLLNLSRMNRVLGHRAQEVEWKSGAVVPLDVGSS